MQALGNFVLTLAMGFALMAVFCVALELLDRIEKWIRGEK